MRFTAGLSSSSADRARQTPAKSANKTRLILNRRMFLRHTDHLRARVRQFDFIGNQADDGAEREHPKSDPDPGNQRKNVGLDHSAAIVGRKSRKIDVEIFVQASPDGYF